ncbi:MAG: YceI family protein [Chitinophagia bacterium]|nr:YceI family protein [Chitinophagia bacterium]
MKKTILLIALVTVTGSIFAKNSVSVSDKEKSAIPSSQKAGPKKTTTSGTISFNATTAKDAKPKAENKTVIASIDIVKGTVAFEVIVKNFSFENPMMQEHFNSPVWMDSEKYPTATFKGNIANLSAINFKKDGTYAAEVKGDLTIHGVTKSVSSAGSISVVGGSIKVASDFNVALADYGVNGPAIAAGKVATESKVSVSAEMK